MKKTILWIPVVAVLLTLAYSSSQTYTSQDLRPFLSENFNLEWVRTYFGDLKFFYGGREVSVDFLGTAAFVEFFIRKGAHFFTFFLLGFFFYWAIRRREGATYKKIFLSFLFVVICAILDETHQYFTGDRTPLAADVVLDSTGGLTGIISASLLSKRKKKGKDKRSPL